MKRTLQDVMTIPAVTIAPGELVAAAARRMHDRGVKQLPVVDRSGALIGIVGRADLLTGFLRSDDEIRVDVLDHVAGDLLGLPLGAVQVEARGGVVRLGGRVPRRSQARVLEKLTGALDGVVPVDSRLDWHLDDTAPQAPLAGPVPDV